MGKPGAILALDSKTFADGTDLYKWRAITAQIQQVVSIPMIFRRAWTVSQAYRSGVRTPILEDGNNKKVVVDQSRPNKVKMEEPIPADNEILAKAFQEKIRGQVLGNELSSKAFQEKIREQVLGNEISSAEPHVLKNDFTKRVWKDWATDGVLLNNPEASLSEFESEFDEFVDKLETQSSVKIRQTTLEKSEILGNLEKAMVESIAASEKIKKGFVEEQIGEPIAAAQKSASGSLVVPDKKQLALGKEFSIYTKGIVVLVGVAVTVLAAVQAVQAAQLYSTFKDKISDTAQAVEVYYDTIIDAARSQQ